MSGWEPFVTMSAPKLLQLQLTPVACLGTAPSLHILDIKAHQYPDIQKTDQISLHCACVAILMTSINKGDIKTGITFFPEYNSASTATLRLWEIHQHIQRALRYRRTRKEPLDRRTIQRILGIICSRRTPKRPLNGPTPLPGPSTVPSTLCETTALLVCAIVSGDGPLLYR